MGKCTWFEEKRTKDGSSKYPEHSLTCAYDDYCEEGSNRCLFHEDKDKYSEEDTKRFSRIIKKMLRENYAIWEDEDGKQYIDLFGFVFPGKLPLGSIIPPKPHMPLCFNGMTQKNDDVIHADLRGISFSGATITGTDFSSSRLDGTILRNTKFGKKDKNGKWDSKWYRNNRRERSKPPGKLRNWLTKLPLIGRLFVIPKLPIFIGANVEAADWADNREAQRNFVYAEYIRQFKKNHPIIAKIWWLFADYGRSLFRWAIWSLIFAASFGAIYHWLLGPESFVVAEGTNLSPILRSFYYSIVTFTTLGFGDIVPKTDPAALWVALEVALGYVMLGGLISIFAVKLARRD